jgi:hypothetical protein
MTKIVSRLAKVGTKQRGSSDICPENQVVEGSFGGGTGIADKGRAR